MLRIKRDTVVYAMSPDNVPAARANRLRNPAALLNRLHMRPEHRLPDLLILRHPADELRILQQFLDLH